MSFVLFILLNGLVLIRPEDFLPEVTGAHFYLYVMIACLLTSLERLSALLSTRQLANQPITFCVLGLLVAVGLSHLVRGRIDLAMDFVPEFAKVIAYYLLLCALVDTPRRFRIFLGWQVIFVLILAGIAVLEYHEYLHLDSIAPVLEESLDSDTGLYVSLPRMCSAGIFNDPNDLCLILVFGTLCSLYQAVTSSSRFLSALWALPSLLFVYSLILTKSRGGLLGLLAAGGTLIWCKYGWRRALPFLAVCLPAAVLAIGGRQSNIDVSGGTGHDRVMLWAEGLAEIFRSPFLTLFGIGAKEYADTIGQDAHNSFVHAYVELGLFGGTLFLGAFLTALWLLIRVRRPKTFETFPGELKVAWPFVMAMIVGYGAGMYSLSRNYIVPTYMCLGLASSFLAMAMPNPPYEARVTQFWLKRLVIGGIAGLVFLKFFTQFAGNLGV